MSSPAAQSRPSDSDFSDEDDSYLLLCMAQGASDQPLAEAAFVEFVRRHWRTLIGFCRERRFETFKEQAEDFVNATLLRAFKRAASYTAKSNNPEQIHRDVQNWLFSILQRKFLDARRRLVSEIRARKPMEGDSEASEPFDTATLSADKEGASTPSKRDVHTARRRTLADKFLNTLTERDRAIFIQTQDYIDPNTGATEPPRDELEALAKQFDIPTDHIRVYRQRILKRLRKFIEEQESNQP